MAGLPTNQKDQIKLVICVVALAAVGAYWYLSWSPKHAELATTELRVDSLEQQNEAAKAAVSKGTVAKLKLQASRYESDLAVMRRLVPSANEVPTLLEEVSTAARGAGLDISEVSPEGVLPGDQFDTYRYKIGVTGPYHQVAAFLSNVGSLPRIIAPINVSLAETPAAKVQKGASKTAMLDAKFEIQTYVVHTGPAVVQQAGKATGK